MKKILQDTEQSQKAAASAVAIADLFCKVWLHVIDMENTAKSAMKRGDCEASEYLIASSRRLRHSMGWPIIGTPNGLDEQEGDCMRRHVRYGRKKPYSEIGISRLPCFRCGEKARFQWQVCADNRLYRTICEKCDIELNKMVLRWMGDPDAESKIEEYERNI